MERATKMTESKSFKDYALAALKKEGSRITKPRLAVIECFEDSSEPMTVKEIAEFIESRKKIAEVDLVTTYRVLERLKALGLVHQIVNSGRYVACVGDLDDEAQIHVLLRCKRCEKVDEQCMPAGFLDRFFKEIKDSFGFLSQQDVFELEGLCRDCLTTG